MSAWDTGQIEHRNELRHGPDIIDLAMDPDAVSDAWLRFEREAICKSFGMPGRHVLGEADRHDEWRALNEAATPVTGD